MMMVAAVITMRMMMVDGGCGDHDGDDDGGCGDHDDLCDKRTLDLSEVSIQGLVNHEDIVVEND